VGIVIFYPTGCHRERIFTPWASDQTADGRSAGFTILSVNHSFLVVANANVLARNGLDV
jgi:hypothetical protein